MRYEFTEDDETVVVVTNHAVDKAMELFDLTDPHEAATRCLNVWKYGSRAAPHEDYTPHHLGRHYVMTKREGPKVYIVTVSLIRTRKVAVAGPAVESWGATQKPGRRAAGRRRRWGPGRGKRPSRT